MSALRDAVDPIAQLFRLRSCDKCTLVTKLGQDVDALDYTWSALLWLVIVDISLLLKIHASLDRE